VADTQIGAITHYFDKINVAIIKIKKGSLAIGDAIKIAGHGNEFTQEVSSMQIEHEPIKTAKKGDEIGMKVDQPVKEGDIVYKVAK